MFAMHPGMDDHVLCPPYNNQYVSEVLSDPPHWPFIAPKAVAQSHTCSLHIASILQNKSTRKRKTPSWCDCTGVEQHLKAPWQCAPLHSFQASPSLSALAQQAHSAGAAAQPFQAVQLWGAEGGQLADGSAGTPYHPAAGGYQASPLSIQQIEDEKRPLEGLQERVRG